MIDDILLQEICSLKEQLKIATKIVKYYEPDMDEDLFMHDLGTEDYALYLENNKKEDKSNVVKKQKTLEIIMDILKKGLFRRIRGNSMKDESKCELCGCYMAHIDNSYLGEGGWVEDESYECHNPKCKINNKEKKQ
jgi:hypothetical protein